MKVCMENSCKNEEKMAYREKKKLLIKKER